MLAVFIFQPVGLELFAESFGSDFPAEVKKILNAVQFDYNAGKYLKCIDSLNKFISNTDNPKHYIIYFYIGNSYFQAGIEEEALNAYKKGIALKSNYIPLLYNVGRIYYYRKEYKAALDIALKIIKIDNSCEYLAFAGNCYYETGEFEQAFNFFEKAIEKDFNADFFIMSLHCLIKLGKYEYSEKKCCEFLKKEPENSRVLLILFKSYLEMKNYEKAYETLRIVELMHKLPDEYYNTLGSLADYLGFPEEAKKYYGKTKE